MTLPRFNAGTSLYKTSVHYHLMGASAEADAEIILPQLRPIGDGGDRGDGGIQVVGSTLSGSFGLDLRGTQSTSVTVRIEGCVRQQAGAGGGAAHFSQTFSSVLSPGPDKRVPFVIRDLQSGSWDVFASSNVTGPVGPCGASVPGILYLGVEGGRGPHCGV